MACPGAFAIFRGMSVLPEDHDVSALVGPARFSTYMHAAAGDTVKASRLYMWNLELAGRWWAPLAYMEVALRNKLHDQLSRSSGRTDWWNETGIVDAMSASLRHQVSKAVHDAGRRRPRTAQPTSDDVVAASSFGLWTSVLHSSLGQTIWRTHLRDGFADTVRRGPLYDNAYKLKQLRNRIAHHEPIFAYRHGDNLRRFNYVLASVDQSLDRVDEVLFPGLRRSIAGYESAVDRGQVDL